MNSTLLPHCCFSFFFITRRNTYLRYVCEHWLGIILNCSEPFPDMIWVSYFRETNSLQIFDLKQYLSWLSHCGFAQFASMHVLLSRWVSYQSREFRFPSSKAFNIALWYEASIISVCILQARKQQQNRKITKMRPLPILTLKQHLKYFRYIIIWVSKINKFSIWKHDFSVLALHTIETKTKILLVNMKNKFSKEYFFSNLSCFSLAKMCIYRK